MNYDELVQNLKMLCLTDVLPHDVDALVLQSHNAIGELQDQVNAQDDNMALMAGVNVKIMDELEAEHAKVKELEMELGDLPQAQREMMLALGIANKERDTLKELLRVTRVALLDCNELVMDRDEQLAGVNAKVKEMDKQYADSMAHQNNQYNQRVEERDTLRQQLEAVQKDAERTCEWTEQDPDYASYTYSSACGEMWTFNDCGPKENRVRYCHGCGGKVVEIK